jgi:hypothetical protein
MLVSNQHAGERVTQIAQGVSFRLTSNALHVLLNVCKGAKHETVVQTQHSRGVPKENGISSGKENATFKSLAQSGMGRTKKGIRLQAAAER